MKNSRNMIECCNNTRQRAPRTGKQTCACTPDLSDASCITCSVTVFVLSFNCHIYTAQYINWHFQRNAEISEVQRHTPTPSSSSRTLDPKTASTVERILKYGRELHALSIRLKREFGKNEANKKALRVCVYLSFMCRIFTFSCPVWARR